MQPFHLLYTSSRKYESQPPNCPCGDCSVELQPSFLVCRYILNKLRMDNRKVFVLALLAAMFGGFIASDWQSIGSDPCSAVHLQELATRELPWPDKMVTSSLSSIVQQNTANYTTLQFRKACEAVSTPEDLCHWNPVSQFTGQYCQTCRPVCRSMRRSLNFFQFCIGVSLMTLAIPLGNIIIAVIASDFTPLESQVGLCIM